MDANKKNKASDNVQTPTSSGPGNLLPAIFKQESVLTNGDPESIEAFCHATLIAIQGYQDKKDAKAVFQDIYEANIPTLTATETKESDKSPPKDELNECLSTLNLDAMIQSPTDVSMKIKDDLKPNAYQTTNGKSSRSSNNRRRGFGVRDRGERSSKYASRSFTKKQLEDGEKTALFVNVPETTYIMLGVDPSLEPKCHVISGQFRIPIYQGESFQKAEDLITDYLKRTAVMGQNAQIRQKSPRARNPRNRPQQKASGDLKPELK